MNLNGTATHEAKAPSYTLLKLDREGVAKAWVSVIRPGLDRVKDRDKRSGFWQPEHVRQRIEAGLNGNIICECSLILQTNATTPLGFVIVTAYNDEFLNVPLYLHVWIAWCEKVSVRKVIPFLLPLLKRRAEELGLRGIQFVTSRFGWLTRLARFGFKTHQYIVRLDFDEGKK